MLETLVAIFSLVFSLCHCPFKCCFTFNIIPVGQSSENSPCPLAVIHINTARYYESKKIQAKGRLSADTYCCTLLSGHM